jgi:uncharacterized protein YaiE (UPF0345 family)
MQLNFRLLSALTLMLFITFTSCKKDSSKQDDPGPELTVHSEDQARVSNEMDVVTSEIDVALESNPYFSGRLQNIANFCGVTATPDTSGSTRKITLAYDGDDCTGLQTRSGAVVISMPSTVRWKDAGAVVTVTYQNLKITRKSDSKSITINGSHIITNVSGGLIFDLSAAHSIIHTIDGNNLSITFNNGTQRSWQVARKRVYSYNNGVVITISGTHTEGTQTNIAEWGSDRFGIPFSTSITQPLVIRQDCEFRLTGGQVQHNRAASSATVSFGLDKDGNATSCPASGSYYYKLTWTGPGGNTQSFIAPY